VILDQQMQEASQQGSDPAESASAGATGGGKGGVGASASMSEVDALIQGYKAQCEPIISLLDSMIMSECGTCRNCRNHSARGHLLCVCGTTGWH
jgi:hypothetical protein